MALPKDIFAFVVMEYLSSKGMLPAILGSEYISYKKDDATVFLYRNAYTIPMEEVKDILTKLNYTLDDFKTFCEYFMDSTDFKIAMEQAIIKPNP